MRGNTNVLEKITVTGRVLEGDFACVWLGVEGLTGVYARVWHTAMDGALHMHLEYGKSE